MPASQLSQLKAALSSAGLNRKTTSKKDKKAWKKGGVREVDRAKSLAKLEDIRKGLNKFDERETRVKHDVGGRNLKGVTGRPSAAKQAGLEQRRKNLLLEHQLRGHTGTFSDRRFGESDPSMSLEDRMLERYTRERQRGQGKKGMFNLEDGDDDPFGALDGVDDGTALGGLTHGGRSVMDLPGDDFDAQGFGEADEEEGGKGNIDKRVVGQVHFGGFGAQDEELPEKKKSKAEVMSEIIAKSKEHKYERQQQREMDAELRDELDEDIHDLRALLTESAPRPSTASLPSAGPSRIGPPVAESDGNGDLDANYDQFVRELAYDARAKPKNRTKTQEEMAVEEKELLEKAEARRLRRMRGEASGDEDEDGEGAGGRAKRRKTKKSRGDADDLDDDFEEDLLGPGLTREDIENMRDEQEDEDDDEEDDDGEGDDDEDQDEDEDEDEDEERDEDEEVSEMEDLDDEAPELISVDEDDFESGLVRKSKAKAATKGKTREIPYTFPCPANIEEFEDILEGLGDEALPTVVQRIRALHHPSLAQGNKEKLQEFLGVLIDYLLILASRPRAAIPLNNALLPHVVALVKLNPITAAAHFTSKLNLMHKNLSRGLARGASNPDAKTLPRAPELVLLRIIGLVWSTSDFSHPVVAPAMLLMGQYLGQSRVRGVVDLAAGLFLCSIMAQYETLSKRIVPEALNFIASTILALLSRRKDAPAVTAYPDLQGSGIELSVSPSAALAPHEPADLAQIFELGVASSSQEVEQGKADVLAVAFRLVQTFARLYGASEAFIELFTPISSVLEGSRVAKLSPELKNLHNSTLSTLTRQLTFAVTARRPLTMQSHKPIPIASRTPKFEDDFTPGRHYDPDVERNASSKLRALYKKERKGAIRELRKDNKFLAGEKARERREKDEGYNARMRKVEGEIQVERAEEKAMQREKAREKKRAGRR